MSISLLRATGYLVYFAIAGCASSPEVLAPPSSSCEVIYERGGRILSEGYIRGGIKNSRGKIVGGHKVPPVRLETGYFDRGTLGDGLFVEFLTPTCVISEEIPIVYAFARVVELAHQNGWRYIEIIRIDGKKGAYYGRFGFLGVGRIHFRTLEAPIDDPRCVDVSKALEDILPLVRSSEETVRLTVSDWMATHPCRPESDRSHQE